MLPGVGPLIALVAASAFFASQTDKFLTGHNLSLIVQQVVVVGALAIGQTIIILTAGIDLSNGNVMALGSVIDGQPGRRVRRSAGCRHPGSASW